MKGGKRPKKFKPNLTQILFWRAYADPTVGATIAKVAKKTAELLKEEGKKDGVTKAPLPNTIRSMYYLWEEQEDYREWRDRYWEKLMKGAEKTLDKVGLQMSGRDYRYWEAMQMKFGNFSRKQDTVNTNINIEDVIKAFDKDIDDKGKDYEQEPVK